MNRDIIDDISGTRSLCVMDFDLKQYHKGRVSPLGVRIAALEAAGGLSNHAIEIKQGLWPDDSTVVEADKKKAIMWRYIPIQQEPSTVPWQLLIFEEELKGAKGDQGDQGIPGTGLDIHGTVDHQDDLTKPETYLRLGVATPVIGDLMMVNGHGNNGWVYKGAVDHKPSQGTQGWQYITNWTNVGPVMGIKGDKGPRGPKGPKGDSGGIGAFILSWLASTVTSTAISVATQVVNDEMMETINAMEDMAQSAAQEAVDKAIDDISDELKGDKGEKGDDGEKGDKGDDGRSCQIVGSYSTLTQFRAMYPLVKENVGKAALIGDLDAGHKRELWAITESAIGYVQNENFGDIRGPKGDESTWTYRLRDGSGAAIGEAITVEPTTDGVPNMYIQGKEGVVLEPFQGTSSGFSIGLKQPLPKMLKAGYLTHKDGKLEWAKPQQEPVNAIGLIAPNGTIFNVTVNNEGRLKVELADDAQS